MVKEMRGWEQGLRIVSPTIYRVYRQMISAGHWCRANRLLENVTEAVRARHGSSVFRRISMSGHAKGLTGMEKKGVCAVEASMKGGIRWDEHKVRARNAAIVKKPEISPAKLDIAGLLLFSS